MDGMNSLPDNTKQADKTDKIDTPAVEEHFYKALAREFIAESFRADSLRPLRKEIRRGMKALRAAYERAVRRGKTTFDEWLGDNYHLLMREGTALLADLRTAEAQPAIERRPAMFRLFRRLLEERDVPDAGELELLVEAAGKARPLTV